MLGRKKIGGLNNPCMNSAAAGSVALNTPVSSAGPVKPLLAKNPSSRKASVYPPVGYTPKRRQDDELERAVQR